MSRSRLVQLLVAAAVAVVCGAALSSAHAQDNPLHDIQKKQREIFERVAPAVVFITQGEAVGSGFFVSSDGVILTNSHVVGDNDEVSVVLRDGRKATGEVIARAARNYDLALVEVSLENTPSIPLAGMDDVRVGNWVASVGHGAGGIWTYTTGMISNIYPDGTEKPVFQTQIPLNPGNSGGPIVDIRGHAIGVVTQGIVQANNINFAIPVEFAVKYMEELTEQCDCLVVKAPEGVPIFVDGVMVGKGPRVMITAERKTYRILVNVEGEPRRKTVTWPQTRMVDMTE
mgnify:CR=1 FL=1